MPEGFLGSPVYYTSGRRQKVVTTASLGLFHRQLRTCDQSTHGQQKTVPGTGVISMCTRGLKHTPSCWPFGPSNGSRGACEEAPGYPASPTGFAAVLLCRVAVPQFSS